MADKEQIAKYQNVVELLRTGTSEESAEALQRIRKAGDSEDAINMMAEARLLLPAASSSSISISTSGIDASETHPTHVSLGRETQRQILPWGCPNKRGIPTY